MQCLKHAADRGGILTLAEIAMRKALAIRRQRSVMLEKRGRPIIRPPLIVTFRFHR